MSDKNTDLIYLTQALTLAKIRRGFCSPNPSVGCVITLNNSVISTGYHMAAGSPHAEADALNKLSMHAPGATAYVTLEPCSHWGKTPPCTDALIQAGIKRVVYGYSDPNPTVSGKGASLLQKNGILCENISMPEINDFYASYNHWLQTKTPFITAKIALSLNGKIAGKSGERIQITGQSLQEFTHLCRRSADALLTTVKTIIHDDPQLNVRTSEETIAKPIYILDRQLQFPVTATLLQTAKSITLFHASDIDTTRKEHLTQLGLRCVEVGSNTIGLDLKQIIQLIGQDGIHDLWVEAGGHCFSTFVAQNLLQKAFMYIAPLWLSDGQDAFTNLFSLPVNHAEITWKQFGNDALCEIRW